jgi:hypothetical protein
MHNINSVALVLVEAAHHGLKQALKDNSHDSSQIKDVDSLLRALNLVLLRHNRDLNASLALIGLVGVSYVALCADRPDDCRSILTAALSNIETGQKLIATINQ